MKAVPISNGEFTQMFRKCRPPTGWPLKIAVANSGGPDSTCLLFLIKRLLSNSGSEDAIPQSVASLSIDHGLQASSTAMAQRCEHTTHAMGVAEHISVTLPWSHAPFPPLPDTGAGEAFENLARHTRYHALFGAMTRIGAHALALGHHADDQVETVLMRAANGTTLLGAGGMRRCRRWGMGFGTSRDELGYVGHEGMHRWIVRPLIDVSKDRLLATCDANRLEYVTDPTNFQPEITLRNAVRHMITHRGNRGLSLQSENATAASPLAISISQGLERVVKHSKAFGMDITGGPESLRHSVARLGARLDDIELEVECALKDVTLPSPSGTYLLSTRHLPAITDNAVRHALVLKVIRYVSFHPWGSIYADARRRMRTIANVISALWPEHDPAVDCITGSTPPRRAPTKFNSGGGVLWWPVGVRQPSGTVVLPGPQTDGGVHDGWLASRMSPYPQSRTRPRTSGLPEAEPEAPLTVDVTRALAVAAAADAPSAPCTVLYDCRFLVEFRVSEMPGAVAARLHAGDARVVVGPHTRWYWPSVSLITQRRDGTVDEPVVLASLCLEAERRWITFKWLRTLLH